MKKNFISLVLISCSIFLSAQSGALDTTFNGTGIVFGNYTTGNNSADAMLIQPDGKILVTGGTGVGASIKTGVSRHNPDGTLDISFGDNGKITFSSGWIKSFVNDMHLQPDGKIVLGGYRWNNSTGDFVMARLNPDGSFDPTFGTNGISIIDGGATEVAESFAVTDDGDFIIAGHVNDHFAMAKVKNNGTIDNSFGTEGWVITPFADFAGYGQDISLNSEGRIILGGLILDGYENKFQFGLAAYLPNGTLDPTFGEGGKRNFHVGTDNDFGLKVLQLKDGKILIGGHSWYATTPLRYELAVAKLHLDGSFDNTYGTNGISKSRLITNGESYLADMVLQEDGKLVLTGAANQGGSYDFGLVRLNEDGQMDTTFGDSGKVFTHFAGTSYGESYNVGIQPDGKILVSGDTAPANSTVQYFIARYLDKKLAVQNINKMGAQLYPNPATNQINLHFAEAGKEYDIEIYNVAGQKVMTSTVTNKTTLNISNLAVGNYLVKLKNDGKTTVLRLIKK